MRTVPELFDRRLRLISTVNGRAWGFIECQSSVRERKAVLDTGLETCSHSCFQVIGGLLQHTGYGSRAWTNLERRARIEPAENMRMKRERITKRDRLKPLKAKSPITSSGRLALIA